MARLPHMLRGPEGIHLEEMDGHKRNFLSAMMAMGLTLAGSHFAHAQSYPDRLIKIVVPSLREARPTWPRAS